MSVALDSRANRRSKAYDEAPEPNMLRSDSSGIE